MTDLKIQKGPCVVCGEIDYPLSMGGPTICPACDCGTPIDKRLDQYRSKVRDLKTVIASMEKTCQYALDNWMFQPLPADYIPKLKNALKLAKPITTQKG